MPGFNLWERDITILIKNGSRSDPENTTFKLNDTYHRGVYLVRDFLEVGKDWLNMSFSNMHCNYTANIKVDPSIYTKYITITYWYNPNGNCIYKVIPEEYAKLTTVKVEETNSIMETIKLNDLSIINYISFFVFWLFLAVYLWIKYIEKKKILVYNKKQ